MGDELKRKYEKIYKDGKESFFSIFEDGENISETEEVVWSSVDWDGQRVIDIGRMSERIFARANDEWYSLVISKAGLVSVGIPLYLCASIGT